MTTRHYVEADRGHLQTITTICFEGVSIDCAIEAWTLNKVKPTAETSSGENKPGEAGHGPLKA